MINDNWLLMMDAEDMALMQAEMQRKNPRSLSTYSIADLVDELVSRDDVISINIPEKNTAYTRVWKNTPETEYGSSGIDIHTARFVNGPAKILVITGDNND